MRESMPLVAVRVGLSRRRCIARMARVCCGDDNDDNDDSNSCHVVIDASFSVDDADGVFRRVVGADVAAVVAALRVASASLAPDLFVATI